MLTRRFEQKAITDCSDHSSFVQVGSSKNVVEINRNGTVIVD